MKCFFLSLAIGFVAITHSVDAQTEIPEDLTKFLEHHLSEVLSIELSVFDNLPEAAQKIALDEFGEELYHFGDVYLVESEDEEQEDEEDRQILKHFFLVYESDNESIKVLFNEDGETVTKEVVSKEE